MEKEKGVVTYEAKDGIEVTLTFETIKKYLVQGHPEWVTPQEMMYFIGICKSRGLNPFAKDCYLIKYSQAEGAAIITSIDYYRKRAKAQKDCKGWAKGIIVERKGEIIDSNGLLLESDTLLGAWFMAQPEGWQNPFRLEINLAGYIKKTKDGSITKFWKKENQPSMIAKVVESQGLRTLWPDEFQQLYTPEEMGEADIFETTEKVAKEPKKRSDKDIYASKVVDAEFSEPEKREPAETPEKPEKETEEPSTKEEGEDPIKKFKGLTSIKFKKLLNKHIEEIPTWPSERQKAIQEEHEKHFTGQPFPIVMPGEKADPPIMLHCPMDYDEIPKKNDEGNVPLEWCKTKDNCNPEWQESCKSFQTYMKNIGNKE